MPSDIRVPYGKTTLAASLPDGLLVDHITPAEASPAADPLGVVRAALENPVGGVRLADFAGARSAAIAINDKTRPVPHQHLLPPLLENLAGLGLSSENITFVIANGAHPPMPPSEYKRILPPEIIARYPIVSHDCEDESTLRDMGTTTRGTPVFINRHFVAADVRLVVGNVEPHQIMGFSGGVKSAAIGLAGKTTITHNHAMMTHADARLGNYDHNPARADVEAIGRLIRVDFALNALLNAHKQIVEVVAGEPLALMQAAIPLIRARFQVEVAAPYDLMIASAGGHPKDINLYQAQKALAHAAMVTKKGGTIILAAACPEGTGSDTYENWVAGMDSQEAVLEGFAQTGFFIGGHKAYQIARDAVGRRVLMVSDMDAGRVKKLLLTPVATLAEGLEIALKELPDGARVGIMPAANATIPVLKVTTI